VFASHETDNVKLLLSEPSPEDGDTLHQLWFDDELQTLLAMMLTVWLPPLLLNDNEVWFTVNMVSFSQDASRKQPITIIRISRTLFIICSV
jgi:hypothetical protein